MNGRNTHMNSMSLDKIFTDFNEALIGEIGIAIHWLGVIIPLQLGPNWREWNCNLHWLGGIIPPPIGPLLEGRHMSPVTQLSESEHIQKV